MKFSIREWRRMYQLVQSLGKTLQDGRPTYTEKGSYIRPLNELSKAAQDILEKEIKANLLKCNKYLDQCGMSVPKSLWHYDPKNPETHASAPEFKYAHLESKPT